MRIAVVGATGMVGEVMLKVLAERNFPVAELIPVASERSVGKEIEFKGKKYKVVGMHTAVDMKADIALFSAGGETSLEWAPKFAAAGTTVIDNSSAWRMDPTKKLVVPEINAGELTKEDKVQQLENEYAGVKGEMAYKYPIHRNAIPQCDSFEENGYTKEEMKLVRETQKILGDKTIAVTATAVRVPIVGGHSEAVNVEFTNEFDVSDIQYLLHHTDGVVVQDNNDTSTYPMPMYAQGKDDVFVGRIRRDESQPNTLNMWIVADNLRKGAATNTVQIAEYLIASKLV